MSSESPKSIPEEKAPVHIEGPKTVTDEMLEGLLASGMTREEAQAEITRRIRQETKKNTA